MNRRARQYKIARIVSNILSFLTPHRIHKKAIPYHRIGIILQWGVGDAVLALPLLQGLKTAFPHSTIELIGKPWLVELFESESWYSETHVVVPPWTKYSKKYRVWDADWREYIHQLWVARRTTFDLLVSIRDDPRELLQLRVLKAYQTAGFRWSGGRYWITNDLNIGAENLGEFHRSEVSQLVLKCLTGLNVASTPQFELSDQQRQKGLTRLRTLGYKKGPIVAVHGGAGSPVRRWGTHRFSAVLNQLTSKSLFIVLVDDSSEEAKSYLLSKKHDFCVWSGSLSELKELFVVCDLLLSCDNGVMHVAAGCKCRVLALFGPMLTEWFGPSGEGHRVIKIDPMPCRPCFDKCIYSAPRCMSEIDEETVVSVLKASIKSIAQKYKNYSE